MAASAVRAVEAGSGRAGGAAAGEGLSGRWTRPFRRDGAAAARLEGAWDAEEAKLRPWRLRFRSALDNSRLHARRATDFVLAVVRSEAKKIFGRKIDFFVLFQISLFF